MKIRQIEAGDEAQVVALLVEGFPSRTADYWRGAFRKLLTQIAPPGFSQLGFVMEELSEIVGVLLMIWTPPDYSVDGDQRANLSSWYVKPQFRSYAVMLLQRATRQSGVTYLNVSAAEHTIQICEALGFKRYTEGQSVSVPALASARVVNKVFRYGTEADRLSPAQRELMAGHVEHGCIGLVAVRLDEQLPFLFVRRRVRGWVPAAQLIYSVSPEAYRECARAIGHFLLRHGVVLVISDGVERIKGMPSVYFEGKVPKYYKGRTAPNPFDLTFTEIPIFGI